MKKPVQEHGASSIEKAIWFLARIANEHRWSAPRVIGPFIPAQESGAFWLFHVTVSPDALILLVFLDPEWALVFVRPSAAPRILP